MSVKIKKISQIRGHGKKKKRLGSFFVQGKAKILPSVKWKYFFEIRFSFEINFAVFGYAPAQNFIIFGDNGVRSKVQQPVFLYYSYSIGTLFY